MNNRFFGIIFRKFYLFIFLINFPKLIIDISKFMKNKKAHEEKKREVIDRFLSILWRKEVGELKYTLKIYIYYFTQNKYLLILR